MAGHVRQHMAKLQAGGGRLGPEDEACVVCLQTGCFRDTGRAYRVAAWECHHGNVCTACIPALVHARGPCPTCGAPCRMSAVDVERRLENILPSACSSAGLMSDALLLGTTAVQFALALRQMVRSASDSMSLGEANSRLLDFFKAKGDAQGRLDGSTGSAQGGGGGSGGSGGGLVLESTDDPEYRAFVVKVLESTE
jgi:hypothetical protein